MSCGRGYSFQAFSGVTALPHLVMSGEGAGFQSAAKTAVETADKTSAISERKSMEGTPTGCKTIAPLGQTVLSATGFVILLRNMHSSMFSFLRRLKNKNLWSCRTAQLIAFGVECPVSCAGE